MARKISPGANGYAILEGSLGEPLNKKRRKKLSSLETVFCGEAAERSDNAGALVRLLFPRETACCFDRGKDFKRTKSEHPGKRCAAGHLNPQKKPKSADHGKIQKIRIAEKNIIRNKRERSESASID